MKNKKTSVKKFSPVLIVSASVLITVLIISAFRLISMFSEYRDAREQYENLSDNYVEHSAESAGADVSEEPPVNSEDDTSSGVVSPISVDFTSLCNECSDIEGWLFCPDTIINYPVVQCDNNDKYLHGYINGDYSVSGSLFIDYRCPGGFSGPLTVIYGHHMKDGSMLASICDYKKQEYYDAHPVMYINTPDCNYILRLFSAFTTGADSSTYTFSFGNDNEFDSYLVQMKGLSDFTSSVVPDSDDRVVMLSTCTYDYDSARYVVFGIIEEIG